MRPSEVTVEVRDINGRPEFLRVHSEFAKNINDHWQLPIGVVYRDRDKGLFLIELPHEADSGTNRLWVAATDILEPRPQKEPAIP